MIVSKKAIPLLVIVIGLIARYLCGLRLPNFDYYSWEIVADLVLQGKIVYSNTPRYNYGPIWFHVLGFLRYLNIDFRFLIITFLSLVDLAIFGFLWKMEKVKEASIFFLCPISIIITGYHHQFENFAILPIFFGVFYMITKYGNEVEFKDSTWQDVIVLSLLIGISLTIKHIFILFPFWLFFQTHHFYKRLVILLLPLAVFGASFLWYWEENKQGIISNVFAYASYNNFPLYQVFYYDLFFELHKWKRSLMKYLFMAIVVLMGFLIRKRSFLDTFLFYTACFVCFSSAIANQYLVIPVLFLAFNFYSSAWVYILIGGIGLQFLDLDGMHFLSQIYPFSNFSGKNWYKLMAFFLFINILSALHKKDLMKGFLTKSFEHLKRLLEEGWNEILIFIHFKN